MNRQVQDDAERRMIEPLRKPCLQQFGIFETILPGIRPPRRCREDIIRHSALLQIEQRILKAA